MTVLILGAGGQVGQALRRRLTEQGSIVALTRDAGSNPDGMVGALDDPDGLRATVARVQPRVIVNAAAYTAVDRAESEPELAQRINAEAPGILAVAARDIDAALIHYSTDYVFDGTGDRPWSPGDPTDPVNTYGRTKRDGEIAVRDAGARHAIFRTQWVHGTDGANFIRSILRLAAEREQVSIVGDQIGAPTSADLIADVTARWIDRYDADNVAEGTFHLAAAGETSWHGVAVEAVRVARAAGAAVIDPAAIAAIPTTAYPTPAPRPLNSRLDCTTTEAALGMVLPPWQDGVAATVRGILEQQKGNISA